MKQESTVRYLGIEVDDALSTSEHVGLYARRARRQALYLSVERAKSELRESPEVVARVKRRLKAAERAVGGENAPND
jgi:hypothetical protein